jgi:MFS transporter, ACS family, glucarate transporter
MRPRHPGGSMTRAIAQHEGLRKRVRYWIIAVIFVLTTINYASRATLSIAGAPLSDELHISSVQMGYLFSAFAWAYVIGQIPGGALLDRFGSKSVYLWAVAFWSLFTAAQALVGLERSITVLSSLLLLRFLLGLAEAPSFPANARLVASWFPNSERGTASAIFNSAQYFSLVVFSPLMGWITQSFGWRWVFLAMGAIGLAAAAVFAAVVDAPTRHRQVSMAELDYIERGGALVHLDKAGQQPKTVPVSGTVVRQLLANRMLLGIYLGQYCITALTYFYSTWFPIYLIKARGLSIMQAGFASAGPAICGWIGGILGGIASDLLLRRGTGLSAARKLPIAAGLVVSGAIILCNFTASQGLVLAFMSIAFFGKGVASLGWAVLSDVAPAQVTGLSGSIFNTFGNLAGIVTPVVIGYIVSATRSFDLALIFVFAHSAVALVSFTAVTGPIRRLVLQPPTD